MGKKRETAEAAEEEALAAAGKINPNFDDNDSVFDDSGTSKKVVIKKKAKTLPTSIFMNGSGNFVSVLLFQIMLSDFMSCLTYWSFLFDSRLVLVPSNRAHSCER